MGKGTIVWHGDRGTSAAPHTSKSVINQVTSLATLTALATTLEGYTECNKGRQGFVDFDGGTPTAPGGTVSVDYRGTVYMKDTATDAQVSITIPGWDAVAHPPVVASEGNRIASADVTAITAAIATATGRSLVGVWGKLEELA